MSSDGTAIADDSALVVGPTPDRFERAATLSESDAVLAAPASPPSWDDVLDTDVVEPAGAVRTSGGADGRPDLRALGIEISERVDELREPDVLLALDPLLDRDRPSLELFRFLQLVAARVSAAGGRLVCTLGDDASPRTVATIAEPFDTVERLGITYRLRAVGPGCR